MALKLFSAIFIRARKLMIDKYDSIESYSKAD